MSSRTSRAVQRRPASAGIAILYSALGEPSNNASPTIPPRVENIAARLLRLSAFRRRLPERTLPRPARIRGDLPHGAEVIGEMRDARDHAAQLDRPDLARRTEHLEPAMRLVAEAAADLAPSLLVHRRRLP